MSDYKNTDERIRALEDRVKKLEKIINPNRPVSRTDKLYEVHPSVSKYGMMFFSRICGQGRDAVYLTDKLVEFVEKINPQLPEEYKNKTNT